MPILRAPQWGLTTPYVKSGWYRHGAAFIANGSSQPGNGRASYLQFDLPPCTIDRIATVVAVAGSAGAVTRFGLYTMGADGLPATLLVDGGTVNSESTGGKEVTVSVLWGGGPLFSVVVPQGSPGTPIQYSTYGAGANMSWVVQAEDLTKAISGNQLGYRQESVTGALGATASAGFAYEGVPRTFLRCS